MSQMKRLLTEQQETTRLATRPPVLGPRPTEAQVRALLKDLGTRLRQLELPV